MPTLYIPNWFYWKYPLINYSEKKPRFISHERLAVAGNGKGRCYILGSECVIPVENVDRNELKRTPKIWTGEEKDQLHVQLNDDAVVVKNTAKEFLSNLLDYHQENYGAALALIGAQVTTMNSAMLASVSINSSSVIMYGESGSGKFDTFIYQLK